MLLKRIRLLPCAIEATKLGYLRNVGWFQSMRARMPVDREGDPIPWFAYAAIHFLEERLKTLEPRCSFSVFEYGVGNSTLWWPKLGFSVTACEHDRAWFARMQRLVPNNVKLMHVDLDKAGEYASAVVSTSERYDIVVIDGRDRANCARYAVKALSETGVIIWDDSLRERYEDGIASLRDEGFRKVVFIGLGPTSNNRQSTLFFIVTAIVCACDSA
jgi:hypothetical protein